MCFLAHQTRAQKVGNAVEDEDNDEDEDNHIADVFPIGIRPHRFPKLQADTTCADSADNGGRAGIGFPEVQGLAGKNRQDLRQHAKPLYGKRGCADRFHAFALLVIDILQRFGVELSERTGVGKKDCRHAGERSGAEGAGEEQRPDQHVHRPQEIEEPLGHLVEHPVAR